MNNYRLIRIFKPLSETFFWLGIWVPYYLKFTNYAGIGIIEAVVITSGFFFEIPTGTIADLLGRKKTLIAGLLLSGFGHVVMGIAPSAVYLVISVIMLALGGALRSGTWQALLYDSLKAENRENDYANKLASIEKISLIVLAAASIIGGLMWNILPALPFLITALCQFSAIIFVLPVKEPEITKEKFTLHNYLEHIKMGTQQLWSKYVDKAWLLKLIILLAFARIFIEVLDASLAINFGFTEEQMALLFAILTLITALGANYYSKLKNIRGEKFLTDIIILIFLISFLISPLLGMVAGGITLIFRNFFYSVNNVMASDYINKVIDSKYRATTLSTFLTVCSVPYIISALFIGNLTDSLGAKNVALIIGLILLAIIILMFIVSRLFTGKVKKQLN